MFQVKPNGGMFPTVPEVMIVDESFIAQYKQLHAILARVMEQGRSANFGLGPDGRWHLRRRAKQVRREFALSFHLPAPRAGEQRQLVRQRKETWWQLATRGR